MTYWVTLTYILKLVAIFVFLVYIYIDCGLTIYHSNSKLYAMSYYVTVAYIFNLVPIYFVLFPLYNNETTSPNAFSGVYFSPFL